MELDRQSNILAYRDCGVVEICLASGSEHSLLDDVATR
jgi:hypothetical protein